MKELGFMNLSRTGLASGQAALSRPQRISWVDTAKGICIACVVYGHVFGGLQSAGILRGSTFTDQFSELLYTFRMPTFLFLAGLFFRRGIGSFNGFAAQKVKTLIFPYILWSCAATAALMPFAEFSNQKASGWQSLLFIGWQPIGILWFLLVLFVALLGLHGFARLRYGPVVAILVGITVHCAGPLVPWYEFKIGPLICRYFVYVAAGFFFQSRWPADLRFLPRGRTLVALLGCSLLAADWIATQFVGYRSIPGGLILPILGVGAVMTFSKALEDSGAGTILRALGQRSLPIYLIHTYATGGMRILLLYWAKTDAAWLHLSLGFLAGLLLPIVVDQIIQRAGWQIVYRWPSAKPQPPSDDALDVGAGEQVVGALCTSAAK